VSDFDATDNAPGPRRIPQQDRSRSIVLAIREAGLLILNESGPAALNTKCIAERAGVGIASLYRYYPNKEAILGDIYEAQVETIDAEYRQRLQSDELYCLTLEQKIRTIVELPLLLTRRLLSLHQGFYREHHLHFEITYRPSPDRQHSWGEWSELWLKSVLETHSEELRVDDTEQAAFIVLSGLRSSIDKAVARYPEYLVDPSFADNLVDMACRYLLK
jgi:AcrR family transcriptional regulator